MLTKKELDALDAMIETELKASKMSEAYKQALKERAIVRAQELSEIKAIRGLDEGTGKKRQKIMLSNGLMVNADAFDD
jgi:hypothetical protein